MHDSTSTRPRGTVLASLTNVVKHYGKQIALDRLSLQVRAGEVLAVLGANGAGKTTALGLLTGRFRADSGQVELFGAEPRDFAVRRGIGVMLQEGGLHDTMRVVEHVHLYSSYYPRPRAVAQTLALAGIEDIARRRYGELSGGQQRRVQFALALCGHAPLLFVDEPTAGLDVELRRSFWRVLRQLRDDGCGIVLTTHYLEEADAIADRVVLLAAGRVLAEDTPAGIKAAADGKCIRARSKLPLAMLASWPEVISAFADDGHIQVRSGQVEALLRRWLATDPMLAELEVRPLNLEEAFVSLTGARASAGASALEKVA